MSRLILAFILATSRICFVTLSLAAALGCSESFSVASGDAPATASQPSASKREQGTSRSPRAGTAAGANAAAGGSAGHAEVSSGVRASPVPTAAAGRSASPRAPTDAAGKSGSSTLPQAGVSGSADLPLAGQPGRSTPPQNSPGADPSAELYAPDQLPRFDISLPEASVTALERVESAEDPLQNEWVHASLRYDGYELGDIGLRLKGEGSFRKLGGKPALKLKVDEFVRQDFLGLKRLTLNNMVEDPSFLAERLAYEVFRALGLPAPRCNSALVYVNGEYYGVYANVEAIDKPFLRRWFSSDAGNLYEEGQRDFVPGAEASFVLETNEVANDRSDLRGLIAALDRASPDTVLNELSAHLDVTHFLQFTAAEAAVNQWDMYAYTLFFPNNFRIYADPASQTFVFVPWGMDMAMKPYRDTGRAFISVFELARAGDDPDRNITAGLIFQRCLQSAPCRARYADTVAQVADRFEAMDLESTAARYYAQIREHVQADTRKEYSEQEFEAGYRSLRSTLRGRAAALRADLASSP